MTTTKKKEWWLDVLREQLRDRGPLSTRPITGEVCFYGNPLGKLAVDFGQEAAAPHKMRTDTFREWRLLKPEPPSVWGLLQRLKSFPAGDFQAEINNRLWEYRKSGNHAVSVMTLYEWLGALEAVWSEMARSKPDTSALSALPRGDAAECMAALISETSRFGRLHSLRAVRKPLLPGYVLVMDRAANALGLKMEDWMRHEIQAEKVNERGYQWRQATPYAALLLLEFLRADKGEDFSVAVRGADALPGYTAALLTGDLVVPPKGFRDIKKMSDPMTRAMAIDHYLYEHPDCVERLRKLLLPEERRQGESFMNQPIPIDPLDTLVEKMALPWAGGVPPLRHSASTNNRLATSPIDPNDTEVHNATKVEVFMADDEPRIELTIAWSGTELPDPDALTAVVYCEARDGETVRTDSMFMDVYDLTWSREPGYIDVTLEITKWNCLLCDWPRAKHRTLRVGSLWPAGSLEWPRPVIGVRISMGRLDEARS